MLAPLWGAGPAAAPVPEGSQPRAAAPERALLQAVTRGRHADVVVGDHVVARELADGQAVIEAIAPRRNEVLRSDAHRTKRLAANVDGIALVVAGHPRFSEEILLRVLVSADVAAVPCTIVVNKCDLTEPTAQIEPRVALYEALGHTVVRVAAAAQPQAARAALAQCLGGRTTLLAGQSGMGKSTILNLLVPGAEQRTQAISAALGAGRHTTTFTRAFDIDAHTRLIDSPGFQAWGIAHVSTSQLMHAIPEFAAGLGQCRFHNCTHCGEPGCAIAEAADAGRIDRFRLELYRRLVPQAEAQAAPRTAAPGGRPLSGRATSRR